MWQNKAPTEFQRICSEAPQVKQSTSKCQAQPTGGFHLTLFEKMNSMNKKTIFFISALIASALLSTLLISNENNFLSKISQSLYNPTLISEKPKGGDFILTAFDRQHSLQEYQGKLVLVYFGYTYCPDICPTDLGNLSITYRNLSPAEKEQVQILFISVDPERDTAARMHEYSNYFEADIIGLTGTKSEIAKVAKQYGAVYAKADQPENVVNYAVDHSAFTYVVDQQGQLQTQLPHAAPPKQITQVIQSYLSASTVQEASKQDSSL